MPRLRMGRVRGKANGSALFAWRRTSSLSATAAGTSAWCSPSQRCLSLPRPPTSSSAVGSLRQRAGSRQPKSSDAARPKSTASGLPRSPRLSQATSDTQKASALQTQADTLATLRTAKDTIQSIREHAAAILNSSPAAPPGIHDTHGECESIGHAHSTKARVWSEPHRSPEPTGRSSPSMNHAPLSRRI